MSRRYWGSGLWMLFLTMTGTAFAQTPPTSETGAALEELVVTARKTTENLQRAPATIDVVTAKELTSGGIAVPTDLTKVLTSATLNAEGAVAQTFIRGVGSRVDFPWTSPASAITYNGIIIPRYGTMGLLFDLSSVQEIAGPQGTLYGGSAAGGAINLLTQQPTNDWSGNMLLEGGNYAAAHVAVNQNVPASDQLSLRTSIDYNRHDGYENNGLDTSNRIEGRESVLYTPSDDVTALVFVSGYRENGHQGDQSILNVKPLPPDPWNTPSVGPDGNPVYGLPRDNQTYVAGANVEWRTRAGNFTYIPGYVHVHDDYEFWSTNRGSDSSILDAHDYENQYSQELRWNDQFGALHLSAGLFWLQDHTQFHDGIAIAKLPASQGFYTHKPIIDSTDQTNTSYSAFVSATYSFNDQLRLTVGGRESEDKISAQGTGAHGAFGFHHSQQTPDWKIGVDYDLTPRVLLYANIQTSYVPFGYNPDVGDPAQLLPRSKLLAYSGGLKSRFLDNKLEVNDEFFYYDYSDFQAFAVNHATNLTQSASAQKSIIYGDELTVRWKLPADTTVDGSIVAQSAHYTEFTGPGFDYSGYQMQDAPALKAVLGLQHGIDLGGRGYLMGGASMQYNSGFWSDFTHSGTLQSRYWKADLLLTYSPAQSNWNLQGFVNNVTNKATFSGTGANAPPLPGSGLLLPPRTFGLRVTTSWH
jgi:iron complex outermembrane recepter protein